MNKVEYVATLASRSEIKSWERKCVAMTKLLDQLKPIENEILEIISKRQPLVDDIEQLRHQMTQECIHPEEHLVDMGEYVLCKFCERKLAPPHAKSE